MNHWIEFFIRLCSFCVTLYFMFDYVSNPSVCRKESELKLPITIIAMITMFVIYRFINNQSHI